MSNRKHQNKKEHKVSVCYLHNRCWWAIFIHDSEEMFHPCEIIHPPVIDFSGERFKKRVQNKAKELKEQYGVTQKQLEEAIIQECKETKKKLPKYLRKKSQS